MARLATVLHNDAPYAERRRLGDEAVAMARRLGNKVALARAWLVTCHCQGHIAPNQ